MQSLASEEDVELVQSGRRFKIRQIGARLRKSGPGQSFHGRSKGMPTRSSTYRFSWMLSWRCGCIMTVE